MGIRDLPRCAGAGQRGLATGARVTAYEHVRVDVELAGGEYVGAQQAVRHGRMVTGQTWQSHPELYREVMTCLRDDRRDAPAPALESAPRTLSAATH